MVGEEERLAPGRLEGAQGRERLVRELARRLARAAQLAVHQAPPSARGRRVRAGLVRATAGASAPDPAPASARFQRSITWS